MEPNWDDRFDRLDDHLISIQRQTPTTRSTTMSSQTSTVTADGLTITRVFDAPRQLVWDAWTRPEHFTQWFGGKDATAETGSYDVRPGGRWDAVMHVQGMEIPWRGQFLEVDPPARLVLTMEDAQGGTDNFETLTVLLSEVDGKTLMEFSQLGGNLSEEQYHQTVEGYGTFFDAMEEALF